MPKSEDTLSAPMGIPLIRSAKFQADWSKLSVSLLKSFLHGAAALFGVPSAALGGTASLFDIAAAVKAKSDPGRDAYELLLLAIGWTLDSVKQDQGLEKRALEVAFKQLLEHARARVHSKDVFLSPDFFRSPSRNELFVSLREGFIEARTSIRGLTHEDPDRLRSRLNATFERAVYEICMAKPHLYQSLAAVLRVEAEKPVATYLESQRYRSALIDEFEGGVLFGQETTKVSLAQLYVSLRATRELPARPSQSQADAEGVPTHEVLWVEDELLKWIDGRDADQLRLVGGGPGSGKSSTLRSLASTLAAREDVQVLLIPLQYIDIDADLRESVNTYYRQRAGGTRGGPVDAVAIRTQPRLIIIFDGLDELAKPGEAADSVAQLFVHKLNQLRNYLKTDDETLTVKIIISGRMPAFQAAQRYLDTSSHAALEVQGFLPVQDIHDPLGIAALDQRYDWWNKYATVFNLDTKPPAAFLSLRWQVLTHEPLLCYLLVLSGYAADSTAGEAININLVYESLINQIWFRGWGDVPGEKSRRGAGRILSQEDFNRLMETIALAAWRDGDTRIASEQGFKVALKLTRCEDAWERFQNENGPDVTNLAMNFYLKSSNTGARGFEFTHKSFGDYLAARCWVRAAVEVSGYGRRKIDHAMKDWFGIAALCALSSEIARFVAGEFGLMLSEGRAQDDALGAVKGFFEELAGIAYEEGFPLEPGGLGSSRALEGWQRNAEIGVWCIINATYRALAKGAECGPPVDIGAHVRKFSLRILIGRLCVGDTYASNVPGGFFCGIVAPESNLFSMSYTGLDFSGADLRNSNLSWSTMRQWKFDYADIRQCRFLRCLIHETKFVGARVDHSFFGGAHLVESDPLQNTRGVVFFNGATFSLMSVEMFNRIARRSNLLKRIRLTDAFSQDNHDIMLIQAARYTSEIANRLKFMKGPEVFPRSKGLM